MYSSINTILTSTCNDKAQKHCRNVKKKTLLHCFFVMMISKILNVEAIYTISTQI